MPKTTKNSSTSDSDSGPNDHNPPASKKLKGSAGVKEKSKDIEDGGKTRWVLEKQRQVSINEFRGRKLVDIREYYEKNGESLPGKKGISLSVEQWKKLLAAADEINQALEQT